MREPIFTAAFVEAQGGARIAQLLDDCYYDLIVAQQTHPPVATAHEVLLARREVWAKAGAP